MPALPEITVDNASGGTVAIPSSADRQEVLLRCRGARTWLGFNEDAVIGEGIWLDSGDGLVIAYPLCQADIYFVSSGTAYIGAETVF